MSEDKLEISGNEESTEVLETSKAPTTQPMLKEILEEMRAFRSEANQRFIALEERLTAVETVLEVFRAETIEDFRLLNDKLSVLTDQLLEVQAKQKASERRVSDLERKAS